VLEYNGIVPPDAFALLKDALTLPAEARAALAASLLESVNMELDENSEKAWRQEIRRRVQEIDSGAVRLVPWRHA